MVSGCLSALRALPSCSPVPEAEAGRVRGAACPVHPVLLPGAALGHGGHGGHGGRCLLLREAGAVLPQHRDEAGVSPGACHPHPGGEEPADPQGGDFMQKEGAQPPALTHPREGSWRRKSARLCWAGGDRMWG